MKRIYSYLVALFALAAMPLGAFAQGWPANYGGVMLQGFYWDSYTDSRWTNLESQAQDFKGYFDLIWVPQSGKCLETTQVMGYTPYYYFNQNSSFGTEAELRSMIKTFKTNGIGTIADVVVNHHNTTGWFGFPAETYNGVTYQFKATDITADDDGGGTATEAATEGVSLSSNKDEGEDWSGMRDLDHQSSNVQTIIKAYENFLLNDLGYTGFRYDMVKGFSGTHVADYNKAANVQYSVGEYWDGNTTTVENWLNATKIDGSIYSAAFDFPFRYNIRDAANNDNWSGLSLTNLMSDPSYRRYSVTFVENHDTQYRSATEQNDPLKKDTLAANAMLIALPGTPCVFYSHYLAYPKEIKAMIDARKAAGITNQSTFAANSSLGSGKYKAFDVTGSNGTLTVIAGTGWSDTRLNRNRTDKLVKVLSGYHYAYYLSESLETPFVDVPSGTYESAVTPTLTAVSANSSAQLVYTTDGSTPSASNGTKVASGTQISVEPGTTLTVGLLVDGSVTKTITRTYYKAAEFEPKTITVYVNVDNVNWSSPVNFHSWGLAKTAGTTWPGTKVTATKVIGCKTWYYNTYTLTSATDAVSLVFSTGSGSPQTVDVNNASTDKFFEISTTQTSGKYNVDDVTSTYSSYLTGINGVTINKTSDNAWYTLSGVRLSKEPTQNGVYIHQGKKVVK